MRCSIRLRIGHCDLQEHAQATRTALQGALQHLIAAMNVYTAQGQQGLKEGVEEVFEEVHGLKGLVEAADGKAVSREMKAMNDRELKFQAAAQDRQAKHGEVTLLLSGVDNSVAEVHVDVKAGNTLLRQLCSYFQTLGIAVDGALAMLVRKQ